MFKCIACGLDCTPNGTNIIGLEIQEFSEVEGWISTETIYKTQCEANQALAQFKEDDITRRVYAVFEHRQFSKFEETT